MAAAMDVKRGLLHVKGGGLIKAWKERYVVLKGGALIWYETEDDVVPQGQISLFGAAVVFCEPPKIDRPNCLEVSTPAKSLFLHSPSKATLQDFAMAIQRSAIISSGGKVDLPSPAKRIAASPTGAGSAAAKASPDLATLQAQGAKGSTAATIGITARDRGIRPGVGVGGIGVGVIAEESPAQVSAAKAAAGAAGAGAAAAAGSAAAAAASGEEAKIGAAATPDVAVEHKQVSGPVEFTAQEKAANSRIIGASFAKESAAWSAVTKARKGNKKDGKSWVVKDVKLRKKLEGHTGFVNAVVSDGVEMVVSGSDDGTVQMFNVVSLMNVGVCKGHNGAVQRLALVGKYIASGADDGVIKLWTKKGLKCAATFETSSAKDGVAELCATADGRLLVSASGVRVQIWDVETMSCIADFDSGHKEGITSMILHDTTIITGSRDKTLRVHSAQTQSLLQALEGHHKNWVFCMTKHDSTLFTGSEGLHVWDVSGAAKGKVKASSVVEKPHACPTLQGMSVSYDGQKLFTVSMDGTLRVWQIPVKKKSKPLHVLENKTKFIFSVTSFKQRIFTADRANVIKVWE